MHSQTVIVPTVGRQVWYRPRQEELGHKHSQPYAATVLHVWSENCVNLLVWSEQGQPLFKSSCILAQGRAAGPGECEWMPYQTKAAARDPALDVLAKSVVQNGDVTASVTIGHPHRHPLHAGITPVDLSGLPG